MGKSKIICRQIESTHTRPNENDESFEDESQFQFKIIVLDAKAHVIY